jgi:hypothetical protein
MGTNEIEGRGNDFPAMIGQHQKAMIRQRATDLAEEAQGQSKTNSP